MLVSFSPSCSSVAGDSPVTRRTGLYTEGHLDSWWTVTRKAGHTYKCPTWRNQDTHFPSVLSQQIHFCHPNLNLSPVPNTHIQTHTHSTAANQPKPNQNYGFVCDPGSLGMSLCAQAPHYLFREEMTPVPVTWS